MTFMKDMFSSPEKATTPSSISTPGYSVSSGGALTRSGPVNAAFDQRMPDILNSYDKLRDSVAPGFGGVTDARVGAARDAGQANISTLRSDLERRKVLGSSFAADTLSRATLEMGKNIGEAKAQSFMEELDANSKLLDAQYKDLMQAVSVQLQELQVSAGVSTGLTQNSLAAQQLYAQQLASQGQMFGTMAGMGISAISPGGLFGTGGTFGAADPLKTAMIAALSKGVPLTGAGMGLIK